MPYEDSPTQVNTPEAALPGRCQRAIRGKGSRFRPDLADERFDTGFRGYAVRRVFTADAGYERRRPGPGQIPGRIPRMARSAHDAPRLGYLVALAMLVLALLFPIGLMVFNPTLMFQRGWEQYVGTAIYLWAVVTLGRE